MDSTPIRAILRQPFREQIAAFRLRLGTLLPTARWDDISGVQHDRAFMVAGAVKADLLSDLGQAVDKAIAEGTSLEEFRADFRRIVAERGWSGFTGDGSRSGVAWRTRVIYTTNLRSTYAAGRHAQLVEGAYPLWVYRHGLSREPRPDHLSWDRLVLPPDHPFWAAHYPPNGWGCSCYVLGARNEAAARRLGGEPGKPLPDGWQRVDPSTGAPVGIDRGWDHAPGSDAIQTILGLRDKLDELPPRPSTALIQEWLRLQAFDDWLTDPSDAWPVLRLAPAPGEPAGNPVVDLPAEAVSVIATTAGRPLSAAEYALAQRVIDLPTAARSIQEGGALVDISAEAGLVGRSGDATITVTLARRGDRWQLVGLDLGERLT